MRLRKVLRCRTRSLALSSREPGEDRDAYGTLTGRCRAWYVNSQDESNHRRDGRNVRMSRDSRAKNYHPVAVHFGRPDIAGYIADTVRDTPPPTPEWSEVDLAEDQTLPKSGKVVQVRRRRIGERETGTESLEGSNQPEGIPAYPPRVLPATDSVAPASPDVVLD